MIWIVALLFHAGLIWAAYWIGERSAGRGIVVFIGGVALFQIVTLGPSSFIDGGCERYSHIASDC